MKELQKRILTSLFLILIIFISFINLSFLYLLLLIINFIVLDEFYFLVKKIYKNKNVLIFFGFLSSIFYMIYFSLTIVFFLIESFETNKFLLFFILIICIATDIGGFIFGKTIGGIKLTSISPKKTISGLIGSFITSIIFGYYYYELNNNFILLNINIFVFIILTSLISQVGDLSISYLKRKANLKDTGYILPGHGGILDRIDGILLALPISLIAIIITS